jgi:hypothetical protein
MRACPLRYFYRARRNFNTAADDTTFRVGMPDEPAVEAIGLNRPYGARPSTFITHQAVRYILPMPPGSCIPDFPYNGSFPRPACVRPHGGHSKEQ